MDLFGSPTRVISSVLSERCRAFTAATVPCASAPLHLSRGKHCQHCHVSFSTSLVSCCCGPSLHCVRRRNQHPFNGGGHGGPMMGNPMQPVGWGMQQPAPFYPNQPYGGMQPGGQMPGGQMPGGQMNQFTDPNNTTVFVGGLSGYVTEDELRSFFQGFGEITYVKIPPGKGCGFVQFVHRHAAEMAINQMQGYPIGNSRVRLSWGRSQNNSGVGTPYRPAPPPPHYGGGPGPYGPHHFGGAFGGNPPPPPMAVCSLSSLSSCQNTLLTSLFLQ